MKRLNANACLLCNRTYAKFEFHLSNLTDMRIPARFAFFGPSRIPCMQHRPPKGEAQNPNCTNPLELWFGRVRSAIDRPKRTELALLDYWE